MIMGKWSEEAWAAALPVYEKILEQPFVRGLADGSLSSERFTFYLHQDVLYVRRYARRLMALAARLPRVEQRKDFMTFASDGVEMEAAMHQSFLQGYEPSDEEMSPACMLYTSVLDTHAMGETEVAAASVLPCFWVYQRVGEHILNTADLESNPYRGWIEAYGDEAFAASCRRAVEICDELAAEASAAVRKRMTDAFVLCTRMEWMFWDSAWQQEKWKI